MISTQVYWSKIEKPVTIGVATGFSCLKCRNGVIETVIAGSNELSERVALDDRLAR